ncbi:ankyrin [Fusarium acutatum]|uniref:Ankyrin n=1 Tax=Fusarium acutatum TaxID=78861 RepID=A0A8H4JVZ5_9HYPO|nr:ankyrin [Fusarium acutatum]
MTSTSPYEAFHQGHRAVHAEPPDLYTEYPTPTIHDTDGSAPCEQQFYRLRTAIIERNDTVTLKKYLQNAPWAVKRGQALGVYYDPFIVAARHGSLDALKMLLDHYSTFIKPVGRTDLDGRCCRVLNEAAHCGHLEVVKLLLDHPRLRADIHHNNNGLTPIMIAAEASYCKDNLKKKEAVINFLLDRGARASDAVPGLMTLNFAAEWAGVDLIRRLIENGADPHVKMIEDKEFTVRTDVTIISTASICANIDALKVLLDCASKVGNVGNAVSYRDNWGSRPLHWACQVPMEEDPREVTAEVMEERVPRIIRVLGLLLDCSPETIGAQDQYGNTPLHYAAKTYSNYGQEHTAIFQYLCDKGADSSIINKGGETALHSLCSYDGGLPIDTAAIEILLDHGAKVMDTDNNDNTPLHLAVKNLENLDAIVCLLDNGADIRAKNSKGNTPLHEAANGVFWPGVVKEKYKRMGDMLRSLQGNGGCLMDELNVEGSLALSILTMPGDNAAYETEEYTVGWVCALPLEMAAARGMLDKTHPNLAQQDPDDHNSYILGEIQGHKIAIACLPAGSYGTNPAATVAMDLLRTFKSIRFGLLVGIGGGAPSLQNDIRLGDVVISQPSGNFGGVVQHDRGKILPQGEFQRTGSQNTPPQLLLSALSCLQATHMTEESRGTQFLSQLNAKTSKRMKGKFSYPGILNDRLYQAEYDHVKQGNATCAECDESKVINREDRGDTDPYFHYGIIASGNQVIKDGKTRERLSQEYGALCFEMEAAGLYNFPCLVIRGICDYADSHKNNTWQEYAAATAAAFAKELLLFVPPNQVLQEKKLVSELVSIHNARYDSEDVRKSPRCEPGTRARILELIQNWADQDSGLPLLWLIGPAGTEANHLPRIIIIDALDECERPENLTRLLGLFSKLCTSSKLHLRVLITSRYAPEIVEAFEPLSQHKIVHILELHREFSGDTTLDIRHFLEARFADIKYKRRVQKDPWPTMEDLDRLVQLSTTPEPLFIYAATLCRFVSDKNRGPIQQLIMWLEQGSKSQLHQIYSPILDQAFLGFDEEEFSQKLRFLGTIVLLARPLSAKSLTLLHGTDLDDISWWVPRLYAVLHVPSELYQPIQLLHKSFSDFLTSDDELGSNSDRSLSSFTYTFLYDHLLHWIEVLSLLGRPADGVSILRELLEMVQTCSDLRQDFVPFVQDAVRVIVAIIMIIELAPLQIYGSSIFFSPTGSVVRQRFWHQRIPKTGEIDDVEAHWSARLQVTQNSGTGVHLHVFSPNGCFLASAVERGFGREEIQLRNIITCTNLYALSFIGSRIEVMAFSADSCLLAAADSDGYIRLWDMKSGQNQQISIGCDRQLTAISFSSDLNLVISVSENRRVQYWERLENVYQEIVSKRRTIPINSYVQTVRRISRKSMTGELRLERAAFSPCMKFLAYQIIDHSRMRVFSLATSSPQPSMRQSIRLSGILSNRLFGFSTDTRLLASVFDSVLDIWDVRTGAHKWSLKHDHPVDAIAFTPSGKVIASSARERIQLWDLETGISKITVIEDGNVSTLAFTPDGLTLASPQQLWDITKSQEYHSSGRDSQCITRIVSSPDGKLLASASRDKTI